MRRKAYKRHFHRAVEENVGVCPSMEWSHDQHTAFFWSKCSLQAPGDTRLHLTVMTALGEGTIARLSFENLIGPKSPDRF